MMSTTGKGTKLESLDDPSISLNFRGVFTMDEMKSIADFRDSIFFLTQEIAQNLADEFTRNKDFVISVNIDGNSTDINCYK